jgi:hypothetical protein
MNLTELVNEVVTTTDLTDPHQIADVVLGRVPDEKAAALLREVMPEVVRARLAARRTAGLPASHAAPGRSWKTTQIRALWERKLADRVPTEQGWKSFGDMTVTDLLGAAELRERMAADLMTVAAEYRTVADLLRSNGVGTVRELPMDVLLGATSAVA